MAEEAAGIACAIDLSTVCSASSSKSPTGRNRSFQRALHFRAKASKLRTKMITNPAVMMLTMSTHACNHSWPTGVGKSGQEGSAKEKRRTTKPTTEPTSVKQRCSAIRVRQKSLTPMIMNMCSRSIRTDHSFAPKHHHLDTIQEATEFDDSATLNARTWRLVSSKRMPRREPRKKPRQHALNARATQPEQHGKPRQQKAPEVSRFRTTSLVLRLPGTDSNPFIPPRSADFSSSFPLGRTVSAGPGRA
mmetsp:Transcript_17634/g.46543  ORF Transcript_17634/g.46543 Transcript_17634/m.46543 type:complete len:247 (+) Transcript_17634:986-1726(+)